MWRNRCPKGYRVNIPLKPKQHVICNQGLAVVLLASHVSWNVGPVHVLKIPDFVAVTLERAVVLFFSAALRSCGYFCSWQVKTQEYSRLSQRMNSDILYDAGAQGKSAKQTPPLLHKRTT